MTKRMNRSKHHNKYIQVNNTRMFCSNSHVGYLQAVNPRTTVISTQLCQFCSFILMKQLTTVSTFPCLCRPSRPSLLQSDWIWSWIGKGHRGYHCLSDPSASSAHTESLTGPLAAPFNRKHSLHKQKIITSSVSWVPITTLFRLPRWAKAATNLLDVK